jgi:hypothetical protein
MIILCSVSSLVVDIVCVILPMQIWNVDKARDEQSATLWPILVEIVLWNIEVDVSIQIWLTLITLLFYCILRIPLFP